MQSRHYETLCDSMRQWCGIFHYQSMINLMLQSTLGCFLIMQATLHGGFSVSQLNLNMTDVALSFDIKNAKL